MKKEIAYIEGLIKNYPRAGSLISLPFHSDAEILKTKEGYLGVSVDAISEEIELKLIQNPKTLGWLTVTASVSDLSAVGIITERVSILLKDKANNSLWQEQFFLGVEEARIHYEINQVEKISCSGEQTLSACTAYGLSKSAPLLSRIGLKADDTLYLTGPIGWGNAVALANIAIRSKSAELADSYDLNYRPSARVSESQFIKKYSRVCIDTSDGLLSTLKWLEIYNQFQLQIDYREALLHKKALEVAKIVSVDPWLFMASQNGEFELLFSISQDLKAEFQLESSKAGHSFLEIGKVAKGSGISINGKELFLDKILDMLHDGVEPESYIRAMLEFAATNEIKFKE